MAKEDIVKLKALKDKPNSADDMRQMDEENSLMKQMVIEKDALIRKMKEAHNKELSSLELEKAAAEEALGNVTREKTKMLDKETVLMDIFKNMRTLMENYHTKGVEIVPSEKADGARSLSGDRSAEIEKLYNCELCEFADSKEENLRNHKLAQHTKFECHLCDYKTHTGESLDSHFDNEHFVPKFKCTECDAIFHTERTLKEHSKKHIKQIHCDYCGFKTVDISTLDVHIEAFHRISTVKRTHNSNEIRNSSPRRVNESSSKRYTLQEQLSNGPCRFWKQGNCKFAEGCKFAHIKVCHYQDECKSSNRCNFYHHSRNNVAFLVSKSRPQPFQLNQREFPTLTHKQSNRK